MSLVSSLRGASNSSIVAAEWHTALEAQDVLKVLLGLVQVHALDGKGSLSGVLEVNTQI